MVLSNTVKILIILTIAVIAIGLLLYWFYKPSSKTEESVSQRFLNQGDSYLEKAHQDPNDNYNISRAMESYVEAANNGDEEGALSLARIFLTHENYYNPQKAYQISTFLLENTRSTIIANRCMEIIEQARPYINNSTPINTNNEVDTHTYIEDYYQQPEPVYNKDPDEPLQISLNQDYTQRDIIKTSEPLASMKVSGFNVTDINSSLDQPNKVIVKSNKKTPDSIVIQKKTSLHSPIKKSNSSGNQRNITVHGRPAQLMEEHGVRILMFEGDPILIPEDFDVDTIEQNLINLMASVVRRSDPPKKKLEDRMKIRNDSQNVHDSKVVEASKQIYRELSKLPNIKPFNQCQNELFQHIKKNEDRTLISRVVKRIPDITSHLGLGADGSQVFCTVWSKISNQTEEPKRTNDIDNFIIELKNCIDKYDNVLCSTGILNRMLGIFEGTGEYENAKMVPDSFYNQEMFGAAGVLRDKLEKDGYDFDKEADQERFKQIFRENMKKDYVDKGVLTETELKTKLVWLDEMF